MVEEGIGNTMIAEALMCLALNVYHEAKNQSLIGQIAVAQVVMNRVRDERYPDTVCEVVEQGPTYSWKKDYPVKNRCQFSWYCDGKSDKPKEGHAWLTMCYHLGLVPRHT
mgnify:CR=1 FL=1